MTKPLHQDVENEYKLAAADSLALSGFKEVVKFSTDDPDDLPVPSRDYLALHAACAKVAHLSAAAEYIDFVTREIEETLVLSSDGASAAALEHAIWDAQCKLISV